MSFKSPRGQWVMIEHQDSSPSNCYQHNLLWKVYFHYMTENFTENRPIKNVSRQAHNCNIKIRSNQIWWRCSDDIGPRAIITYWRSYKKLRPMLLISWWRNDMKMLSASIALCERGIHWSVWISLTKGQYGSFDGFFADRVGATNALLG